MQITDDNEWRISKSGYTIKTGWHEKRTIANSPCNPTKFDSKQFEQWLDDAREICHLHNAGLTS